MSRLDGSSFKVINGKWYKTPKEIWGFRTRPRRGSALDVARDFLAEEQRLLQIGPMLHQLRLRRIRLGLGANHVIFEQRHAGKRVNRGYVTVHLGGDGSVYLVTCRAVPEPVLREAPGAELGANRARALAVRAVGHGRRDIDVIGRPEPLWYPARTRVHPAWRVRVRRRKPCSEYIVHVDARTGSVLEKYDNLALATGRGLAFLPNPMALDPDFEPLVPKGRGWKVARPGSQSYAPVRLSGLAKSGYLDGRRVSTRLTPKRIRRTNLDFSAPHFKAGFEEVSSYYHIDAAIRYVESLGYVGPRRLFAKPLLVNARGTPEDESWYSPGEKRLTFGLGDIDDAEDGETVLHEFGHAIQDLIVPDFGLSFQAAAMGEGFGDYFAGSFFADRKPKRYRDTVMSWDGALFEGDPPCVRRLDSPHTYESFEHRVDREHENGEIWSAALWEIRAHIGRDAADRIIIDSHFQLDPHATFGRGARAILDADRNLFDGKHRQQLLKAFRRRGIGPVE